MAADPTAGGIFPLKPFVNAFQNTLNPLVESPGFSWVNLAVVAAWGVGGAILARKTFKWEPPVHFARPSRRRRSQASA